MTRRQPTADQQTRLQTFGQTGDQNRPAEELACGFRLGQPSR